jgi:hypothetical protein
MPTFNGNGDITTETPGRLLEAKSLLEEPEEDIDFPLLEAPSPPFEIKGTFQKTGTPRPVTLVAGDLGELDGQD